MKLMEDLLGSPEFETRGAELRELHETFGEVGRVIATYVSDIFKKHHESLLEIRSRKTAAVPMNEQNDEWQKSANTAEYRDLMLHLGAVMAIIAWAPAGHSDRGIPSGETAREEFRHRVTGYLAGESQSDFGRGSELFNRLIAWKTSQVLFIGDPLTGGFVDLMGESLSDQDIEWFADLLMELSKINEQEDGFHE